MKNCGMIAAMAIAIGMVGVTVSCKKEQVEKHRKAEMTVEYAKDGGDDDEDPVIRGKVKKPSGLAVNGALVETLTYGTNTSVGSKYTDSLGEFAQTVVAGIYYFRVTPPSSSPFTTDTVHVNSDVFVNITTD